MSRFRQRWALVVMLTVTLAGCGEPTKTYGLGPEAAKAALVGTTIPGLAFAYGAHSDPAAGASNRVVWNIRREPGEDAGSGQSGTNHTMIKLVVTLTAAAGGTQVAVALQSPDGVDPAAVELLSKQDPAVANLWRSIALEQVDATLTHRAFSIANIRQDIAVSVVTHLPQIRQQMDDAAKEFDRRDQEKVDSAYASDRPGG